MNSKILHTDIQDFIAERSNTDIDITSFILSGSPFSAITAQELAQQINGRRKAKDKLPLWYQTIDIYYPPALNLEQTSSQATALYKSSLIAGDRLIDLTGGFGIDDYYFSKKVTNITHCELNTELSDIVTHNFKVLQAHNIETIAGDGLEILKDKDAIDWIYIDPSRRHDSKGKVFFLEDCLPNVPQHLALLFSKSKNILLKTSPLLDLYAGIQSLKHVKEIHIVALHNEVKELLWVLEKNTEQHTKIHTVNLIKDTPPVKFSFFLEEERTLFPEFSLPKKHLYEPNASILKSGGFLSVAKKYQLAKLHINSHLYTSDALIDFPGRRFKIQTILPYQKQVVKKAKIAKANITTRNFPESVAEIRKKFKIKDGGDAYLFFTTNYMNKKIVLVCAKV